MRTRSLVPIKMPLQAFLASSHREYDSLVLHRQALLLSARSFPPSHCSSPLHRKGYRRLNHGTATPSNTSKMLSGAVAVAEASPLAVSKDHSTTFQREPKKRRG